jgi:two-component system OmpR family response regulator/two-component system response regulator RstA
MNNYVVGDRLFRLLVVEDDIELASLVREYLSKNGFEVSLVGNGLQAVDHICTHQPDMVILDIMLPGMSGMDVCREVRQKYSGPILMLTALDEDIDQMLGLELGADDYIIKPIKPRLLLSRVRALLRRIDPPQQNQHLQTSDEIQNHPGNPGQTLSPSAEELSQTSGHETIEIDLKTRSVRISGQTVILTTAEFDLLRLLADELGNVVSRGIIVQSLRGFDYDGLDRSIDRRISRLRKKLNDDPVTPYIIKTIRGKGYLLCITANIT